MKLYTGDIPTHMQEVEPEANYDWMEVVSAGFMQESDFGVAIESAADPIPEANEDDIYNWTTNRFIPTEVPEFKASRYNTPELENEIKDMKSSQQVLWRLRQWDKEWSRMQVEEATPWYQIIGPQIAGSMFGVEGITSIASFGTSWATKPLRVGATIGGSTALRELYLQNKQQFRPWERSVVATGAAAGISAGVSGLLSRSGGGPRPGPEVDTTNRDLYRGQVSDVDAEGAVGADRVKTKQLDDIDHDVEQAILNDETLSPAEKEIAIAEEQAADYSIANEGFMKAVTGNNVLMKPLPDMRMLTSPFAQVRRLTAQVTNMPLKTVGHMNNRGNIRLDIEAQIGDIRIAKGAETALRNGYGAYVKALPRGEAKMNYAKFNQQVRDSITDGHVHADANVSAAGKELYEKVIAPEGRRMVRAGVLKSDDGINPAPPLGDKLWMPRVYSRSRALRATPEEYFQKVNTPEMKQLKRSSEDEIAKMKSEVDLKIGEVNKKLADAEAKLKGKGKKRADALEKLRKAATKERSAIRKEMMPYTAAYKFRQTKRGKAQAEKRIEEMRQKVASGNDNVNAYSGIDYVTAMRGDVQKFERVTGRTIDARTVDFDEDMFEGDVLMGLIHTLRRQNRMLTVAEAPQFRDFMLTDRVTSITKEFEARKALLEGNEKATEKLAKQYEAALKYVNYLIKQYYGIKAAPQSEALQNTAQMLKLHATVSSLGSVMASVQSEIAAPILNAGFAETMRVFVGKLLRSKEFRAMSRQDKADTALGIDISNVSAMLEKGTYDMGQSAAMRKAHKFGDWTVQNGFGLGLWTNWITTVGSIAQQSRTARLLLKDPKKLTSIQRSDLAEMGIDENWVDAMADQVRKYHTKEKGGSVIMNLSKWDDQELAERMVAGIHGKVDNSIIKVGTASTPFTARDNLFVSLALQFKTFALASTSKWYMQTMQKMSQGDIRGYQFLVGAQAMGMISGELKRQLYGRDERTFDEVPWSERMKHGFLYGGVFGIIPDVFSFAEVAVTGESMKYQGNRTAMGTLIGAWGGNIDRAYQAVGAISNFAQTGEVTASGLRAGFGILPYNNQIIARPFVNQYKDYLLEEYGKD